MDKDRTGTITLDELIAYFDAAGIPHDDLAKTFQVLDVDKDGTLSFSEFSTGALLLFQDALEDELHMLFASYDSNNDGILTTSEAETFLDSVRAATDLGGRSSSQVEAFLKSGQVSFQQLKDFLVAPVSSRPSSSRSQWSQRSNLSP